jgi:hypothetical protein
VCGVEVVYVVSAGQFCDRSGRAKPSSGKASPRFWTRFCPASIGLCLLLNVITNTCLGFEYLVVLYLRNIRAVPDVIEITTGWLS